MGYSESICCSPPNLLISLMSTMKTRQEVCETLHYFRAYQGGVYYRDDIVRGYLLGGHGTEYEYTSPFLSTSLIAFQLGYLPSRRQVSNLARVNTCLFVGKHFTHLSPRRGGKNEILSRSAMDQSAKDVSVRSLINTRNSESPVILLADDSYKYFPYDLAARGYCYVVLGAYVITDAWREHTLFLCTAREANFLRSAAYQVGE